MITLRDLSNIIGIDLSQVDENAKMTELGADSVKLVMLVVSICCATCLSRLSRE